ncbi:choline ABC transporter ATP binding protein [Ligilactobacillus hayakitensis DSM 18933 = JCM 14209]|uniref:ABC-type quaternary amine transporter n=1 Tax=Ligilactobacillus hayakitensis DSM 18933 = JCM 14209 TaxID=1423755 RepID=A0A0R1WIR1_9LACO|nr:ABC transporter ATP-binding protein [Ligilactobacillus hayakitensis]KRM17744.1 choline ABC transporter ATP binding protein [Ligilactobacillus hayakitensis DSM 18933 = JCM 14209]
MIEFKNVSKKYQEKEVLKSQSFTIEDGEFVVLVGPSGSGKTTLLKMINRLIEPTSGEILIDKKPQSDLDLRQMRFEMGYVLQQASLFPNMTVIENALIIPKLKRADLTQATLDAKKLLHQVGLDDQAFNKYPNQLSGGEQQRVGIVRALMGNPKILLMDEPFSALDAITKKELQVLIKDLQRKLQLTVVFVTHDTTEALKLADRVAVLHQGELVQFAKPDTIIKKPADAFVADLFKEEIGHA